MIRAMYSVPYQGGVAAIAVNTDMVDIDIDSYADLFDPSPEGFPGGAGRLPRRHRHDCQEHGLHE